LVPAIHVLRHREKQDVDARPEAGHDESNNVRFNQNSSERRLLAQANVQPNGRGESAPLNFSRSAGNVKPSGSEIDLRGFALDRNGPAQPELGAPANRPASFGIGVGL